MLLQLASLCSDSISCTNILNPMPINKKDYLEYMIIDEYIIDAPVLMHRPGSDTILFLEAGSVEEGYLKDHLSNIAKYFKKEMRFDRLQYDKNMYTKSDCVGFLFISRAVDIVEIVEHHPRRVIGGGCFRILNEDEYELDWIWLHPFARNRGELRKRWSPLQGKFGQFAVAKPLSAHMASFILKHHGQS